MTKIERWKPEHGDIYWIIDFCYPKNTRMMQWENDRIDNNCYEHNNCFKTEAEAQAAAEKVKALLLSLPDNGNNLVSNSPDKQLPDWVEIGGYVYDARNGYGKIVSGSVKSCYIEFDGGAGDFVPEAFAELKQARLRPYNAEELENLVGKVIKTTGQTALVIGFIRQSSRIVCGLMNNYLSGESLLDLGVTIAGKPAGVLEHLEDGEWKE